MRVALFANWGLGRAILDHLAQMPGVQPVLVVTRLQDASGDPFALAAAEAARRLGILTLSDDLEMSRLALEIKNMACDLLISHAFMRILPPQVYKLPRLGGVNIHASLLPKYRGPSPTFWALKNRDPETGLTCHYLSPIVDAGDIVHQTAFPLEPGDDNESVIEKQKAVIGELLNESLARLIDPGFTARKQDESRATHAPRR